VVVPSRPGGFFFSMVKTILDSGAMRRAIERIAHEILEQNQGCTDLVLVGVRTRGVPLAERIADVIHRIESHRPPVGQLDITMYRDDLSMKMRPPSVSPTDIPHSIDNMSVVIVDDVLYTGRSVRAAMDALNDHGRPRTIQLAVMIDRGHRELPIRADYVGKNLPTGQDEQVVLQISEFDGEDLVALTRADDEL